MTKVGSPGRGGFGLQALVSTPSMLERHKQDNPGHCLPHSCPTKGLPKFCLCPASEHSKCVQCTADDVTGTSQLWKLYTPLWSNSSKNRLQPKLIKWENGRVWLPPGAGSHQQLTATPSQKVWRSYPHIHPILKFTLPIQPILPSPLCCKATPGGQRPLLFQLRWPL